MSETKLYESDYHKRIHGVNPPINVFMTDVGVLTWQIMEDGLDHAGCIIYLLVDFTLETRLLDLGEKSLDMLIKYGLEEYLEIYYKKES